MRVLFSVHVMYLKRLAFSPKFYNVQYESHRKVYVEFSC